MKSKISFSPQKTLFSAVSSLRCQFASLSVRNRRLLSVGLRPCCSDKAIGKRNLKGGLKE